MNYKRCDGVLINSNDEGYLAAKKRNEMMKERKRRELIVDSLDKRVSYLEKMMEEILRKINDIS